MSKGLKNRLEHYFSSYLLISIPIEEAFQKLKEHWGKWIRRQKYVLDPEELVLAAFSIITPQECEQ